MTIKEVKELIERIEQSPEYRDDIVIMFSLPEDPSQYFTSEGCMFSLPPVELHANQG